MYHLQPKEPIKKKPTKHEYIKIKYFPLGNRKTVINKVKDKMTNWEKYFQHFTTNGYKVRFRKKTKKTIEK